jgi:hypothetical protein
VLARHGVKVECVCGKWHDVSPTALAVIVSAFMDGDMHTITSNGLAPICLSEAFNNDERVNRFLRRYPKHVIVFDGVKIEKWRKLK